MSFAITNFRKNMNTFIISTELFMNDRTIMMTDKMKLVHKLI